MFSNSEGLTSEFCNYYLNVIIWNFSMGITEYLLKIASKKFTISPISKCISYSNFSFSGVDTPL